MSCSWERAIEKMDKYTLQELKALCEAYQKNGSSRVWDEIEAILNNWGCDDSDEVKELVKKFPR